MSAAGGRPVGVPLGDGAAGSVPPTGAGPFRTIAGGDGDGTGGVRRAAAYAHGLSDADRAWLLAALAPVERAALAPLLAELDALVGPRVAAPRAAPPRAPDASAHPAEAGPVAPRADAGRSTPPTGADPAADATDREPAARFAGELASRPLRDLAARLAPEPDDVVRLVAALAPAGPARDRVLRALDPARRRACSDRLAGVDTDSARAAALVAAWTSTAWAAAPTVDRSARLHAWLDRVPAVIATLTRTLDAEWKALRRAIGRTLGPRFARRRARPTVPWGRWRASRRTGARPEERA